MITAEPVYMDEPKPEGGQLESLASDQSGGGSSSSNAEPLSMASSTASNSDLAEDDHHQPHHHHHQQQQQFEPPPIKCSAVHTLERDMPDFDYSHLVDRLRELILEHCHQQPGTFSQADLDKCRHDNWFLSRFLLRQQLELEPAFEMLKGALRFNHESLASHLKPEDFPAEFYQLGGMVPYGHDRKGNKMLYLRIKIHKKVPEITSILQSFIYYNIKHLDDLAEGKGISIVIVCNGAGLANADMETLSFLINTLKSYFPKGLSYFLVHELPWILKPFWHIAKAWISQEHRDLIKFSDANNVAEFIDPEQLPDFMGGHVEERHWKKIPEGCILLEEAAKLWGIDKRLIGRMLARFKGDLPAGTVARIESHFELNDKQEVDDDDDEEEGEGEQQRDERDGYQISRATRNQMFSN